MTDRAITFGALAAHIGCLAGNLWAVRKAAKFEAAARKYCAHADRLIEALAGADVGASRALIHAAQAIVDRDEEGSISP